MRHSPSTSLRPSNNSTSRRPKDKLAVERIRPASMTRPPGHNTRPYPVRCRPGSTPSTRSGSRAIAARPIDCATPSLADVPAMVLLDSPMRTVGPVLQDHAEPGQLLANVIGKLILLRLAGHPPHDD